MTNTQRIVIHHLTRLDYLNPVSEAMLQKVTQIEDMDIAPVYLDSAIASTKAILGNPSWLSNLRTHRKTSKLNDDQLAALFLAEVLGRENTGPIMMKIITEGSEDAMKQLLSTARPN